jgi:hypothetical protein
MLSDALFAFREQENGWSAPLGAEQRAKRKMDARAADLFIDALLRYCVIALLRYCVIALLLDVSLLCFDGSLLLPDCRTFVHLWKRCRGRAFAF